MVDHLRRVADGDAHWRNGFSDNRSRDNNRIVADADPLHDDAAAADRRAVANDDPASLDAFRFR